MGQIQRPEGSGADLSGRAREQYVRALFDHIALPYDRLNHIISLGRDRAWRRLAVRLSAAKPGDRVVDMGTGTGDLALEFASQVGSRGLVLASDMSLPMLACAAGKLLPSGSLVHLVRAKAQTLPVKAAFADVVCMGWVLRNVGERRDVYREILRVLKPGGCFVCVEMSHPRGNLARLGFYLYRHLILGILVRFAGGDREAYGYLADSTDHFPHAQALEEELIQAGFEEVSYRPLMIGAVAIHRAFRGHAPPA